MLLRAWYIMLSSPHCFYICLLHFSYNSACYFTVLTNYSRNDWWGAVSFTAEWQWLSAFSLILYPMNPVLQTAFEAAYAASTLIPDGGHYQATSHPIARKSAEFGADTGWACATVVRPNQEFSLNGLTSKQMRWHSLHLSGTRIW